MPTTTGAGHLKPPPMSYAGLSAALWGMTGFTILVVIFRYYIRLRLKQKLLWDDLTYGLAVGTLIAGTACQQALVSNLFYLANFSHAEATSGFNPTAAQLQHFSDTIVVDQRYRMAGIYLFIIGTWAIKATLMTFYYSVFNVDRAFMIMWWVVTAVLGATFIAAIVITITMCGAPANAFNIHIFAAPSCLKHSLSVLEATCGLNVLTDLLVIALPWKIIRELRITVMEKLGIAGVFSFGFLIVAIDIARTVQTRSGNPNFATILILFVAELCIAVIVGAMPVYRNLGDPGKRRKVSTFLSSNSSKSRNASYGKRGGSKAHFWSNDSGTDDPERNKSEFQRMQSTDPSLADAGGAMEMSHEEMSRRDIEKNNKTPVTSLETYTRAV